MNIGPIRDLAIKQYQRAFKADHGKSAPGVRPLESGSYSVLFAEGPRRYTKQEFEFVTRWFNDMAQAMQEGF